LHPFCLHLHIKTQGLASPLRSIQQLGSSAVPNPKTAHRPKPARFNWAGTLTQSGANYPFVLAPCVDRIPEGLKVGGSQESKDKLNKN